MEAENYQYEAADVAAFVSQIVRYVQSGHFFYVRCLVPEGKEPDKVARKLIERYDIRRKRWQRKRRHLKSNAGIHYLSCNRLFVIMLTHGKNQAFYDDHKAAVMDIRRQALKAFGYSIRFTFSESEKAWKVFVRLDNETRRKLKAHLLTIAVWESYRDSERLEREFSRLPYQSYAPVYSELISILRQVNRERRKRGFSPIDSKCIRKFRRPRTVFKQRESTHDSRAA